ncbi:MAG: 50S ribosomal protein L9 [Candidatus Pacebacteria bacterium]|nr:50S ribosomal protein L9 [Candidatus Paceibacterota bacterium]
MKVILLKDVPKVGQIHEIKEVSDGFALNSLIPRKLAVVATPQAIAAYEKLQKERKVQHEKHREQWQHILARLSATGLSVSLPADEGGHLYKKLDARTLARLFEQEGLAVEHAAIQLPAPISSCGQHSVSISTKEGKGTVAVTVHPQSKKRS